METVTSVSWGQPPPVELQRGHLGNIRFYKGFLKGALWESAGDAGPAAHQPGTGAGRYRKILHFYKVLSGFRRNGNMFQETVTSALCGGVQKHKEFPWFLEVPKGWLEACPACMHLLGSCCPR